MTMVETPDTEALREFDSATDGYLAGRFSWNFLSARKLASNRR